MRIAGAPGKTVEFSLATLDQESLLQRAKKRSKDLHGKIETNFLGVVGEECVVNYLVRQLPALDVRDVSSSGSTPADVQVKHSVTGAVIDLEVKTVPTRNGSGAGVKSAETMGNYVSSCVRLVRLFGRP